jgi:hypothetical protein
MNCQQGPKVSNTHLGAQKSHSRLEHTAHSKILLKTMQITGGLTLGTQKRTSFSTHNVAHSVQVLRNHIPGLNALLTARFS